MTQTVDSIRAYMASAHLDAVVLKTRANFSWVTGGRDNHIENTTQFGVADLIVFPDRLVCVTNSIEERRIAEEELFNLGIEMVAPYWTNGAAEVWKRLLGDKRVGADVPDPVWENVSAELSQLRRTFNEQQIRQYRWLCREAGESIESVAKQVRPGQSEYEIAALLSAEVIKRGMTPVVTLVSTDDRVFKYRHPIPTVKTLEKYAMLVLCAEKYGLVASATRFVHFGDLPPQLAENREKCAYIDVRMNAATRPGKRISDVFQTAIEAYREVGYPDDWQLLHQGGPAGYAPREFLATPETHDVIRVGQAYAWNPAIRGIKSEDTILVGENDNEFLTQTGNWPYIKVEFEGRVYQRPDILVHPL